MSGNADAPERTDGDRRRGAHGSANREERTATDREERTATNSEASAAAAGGVFHPAYGPVDAVLGYVLFYVVVERVTPAVVDVVTDAFPGISQSTVTFGLAALIWVALGLTVVDQVGRQVAAFRGRTDETLWARIPSETEATVASLAVVVGGALAASTFTAAMATLPDAVRALATFDVAGVVALDVVTLATFFVSYAAATWGADRLLVGGMRVLWTE
ncbi:hypothetical protein [Halorubellus salinus]|uniref:hypothetical protein n=1 Tax=Halorubellus salinus TaxID=755309 RepID=UPI001D07BD5A|nr:hypothetical protein [Halorubellus salinus]